MSAIDQLFSELRSQNRKAFMPFVTAGDPDLDFTRQVIEVLHQQGSHLCEIGIPYSDPIADGPVIQASYTRALSNNVALTDIFEMISGISSKTTMPMITMVSYAIVYRRGVQEYVQAAKRSGIAGLIVPDLPVEESSKLAAICKQHDVSLIQLITPTTSQKRAIQIAENTTGFIYYVSVTGITGERQELPAELVSQVQWLRDQTELPICIGFGISKPEHVRQLAPVADGLIVGSAIVRRIAEANSGDRQQTLNEISQYVTQLLEALNSQ